MAYKETMQPIQVWSPLILNSMNDKDFKKDLLMAEYFYDEEDIIWFSPKADKLSRWKEDAIRHLMIPTKSINKITVYNIDELGRIYPSIGKIKKLDLPVYTKWLKKSPKTLYRNKPLKIAFPTATKKEAYYKDIVIDSDIAFIRGYKKNNKASTDFKDKKNPFIIDYELDQFDDFLEETKIPNNRHIWPEPFNDFFITGGGMNVLIDFFEIKRLIEQLPKNRTETIQVVQTRVQPFLTDIESSIMRFWYMPKLNFGVNVLLSEIESKFGLYFENIEDLNKRPEELDNIINNRITIKRAYSWLGYFWWEFYQDLLEDKTLKLCKNCHQIFSGGRQDRIYCTKEENPTCWNKRLALRKKKEYDKKTNQIINWDCNRFCVNSYFM